MNTDSFLLDRIRGYLQSQSIAWSEKRMFGGVCFMVDDKMLTGTFRNGLMARVNPEETNELLTRDFAEQMKQKDRIMKGYILVHADGYDQDDDLEFWLNKCLEYNPIAKSSKKRKK